MEPHNLIRSREVLGVAVLFLAIAFFQLLITRHFDLFTEPLWLDETLTWLIANDPSFTHALGAVRGGVDTNPPALYVFLWPIARMIGGLNEVGLRAISFVSIAMALLGMYAICRRFFGRAVSFATMLAMWGHGLAMFHAFEARFYGPWLAVTVWLCHLQLPPHCRGVGVVVRCLLAVLVATLHWFGLIAIGLLLAGEIAARFFPAKEPRPRDSLAGRLLPLLIGAAAVLACLPIVSSQRAGLSVKTWIEPLARWQIEEVLYGVLGQPVILLVVLLAWARRVVGQAPREAADQPDLRPLVPTMFLLFLPGVLVAMSVLVQPVMQERYVILTLVPLAAMSAWLLSGFTSRWQLAGVMVLLIAAGAAEVVGTSRDKQYWSKQSHAILSAIDKHGHQVAPTTPILFKRRLDLYPMQRLRPELLLRARLIDFDGEPGRMPHDVMDVSLYERDMARKVARHYGQFELLNLAALDARTTYLVVGGATQGYYAQVERAELTALMSRYELRPLDGPLFLAVPKP